VSHRILIIDPNQSFATMLSQSLEESGDFQPSMVNNGHDALEATTSNQYDLVIVDMGLKDMGSAQLIHQLRQEHPQLPVMIIPLEGDEIPSSLDDVEVQGTLPKPFFLPELPDRIRRALVRQSNGEEPIQARETSLLPDQESKITQHMTHLAQEANAKAVILTQDTDLVAHVSRLSEEEVISLADLVRESWHTSARMAKILGKEQIRFEQSIEGDEYLLYSLALPNSLILSIVVEGHVPLGMIRHRAKETAEELRQMLQ
jgi:two-component system OmpR family response regulator